MRCTGGDYFDRVGPAWDRLQASFYSERVRERALAAAGVRPGRDAADVGAGTGFVTRGLLELGLRVVAVDRSAVMLDALRRKFPGSGGLECRVGEAELLPIADASMDYCFANMLLHHVEDPPLAIAEMARILRPGGRLVLADLDSHASAWLREEHQDRWLGFEHRDVRVWLLGAGLESVRVEDLGERCCAGDVGQADPSLRIFLAVGIKSAAG